MPHEKLQAAATEGLEVLKSCYVAISKLELPNDKRVNVAIPLAYSSLEQGRSACYLVANDPDHCYFAAIILFRSQLEQLMRAQFFAQPASEEQLQHFLDTDTLPKQPDGQKLGPKSLARINTAHFGWDSDKLTTMVAENWKHLSAFAHGGRAVLNFYRGEDGIGPAELTNEFIEPVANMVVLGHLAVALAIALSNNHADDDVQAHLKVWFDNGHSYFAKWAPKLEG